MSTADAVQRETDWLSQSGDGLPALLKTASGPWDVINAYWPRTPNYNLNGIYVMRTRLIDMRWSNQRKLPRHSFRLKLLWRIGSTTTGVSIGEAEQANFDSAVDLLLQRLRGTLGNKTHGGRFLSVAEAPGANPEIPIDFDPPETTMERGYLSATVNYQADDLEVVI